MCYKDPVDQDARIVLMYYQILRTNNKRNVWQSLRRINILSLRLKGLTLQFVYISGDSLKLSNILRNANLKSYSMTLWSQKLIGYLLVCKMNFLWTLLKAKIYENLSSLRI